MHSVLCVHLEMNALASSTVCVQLVYNLWARCSMAVSYAQQLFTKLFLVVYSKIGVPDMMSRHGVENNHEHSPSPFKSTRLQPRTKV